MAAYDATPARDIRWVLASGVLVLTRDAVRCTEAMIATETPMSFLFDWL